MSIEFNPMKFTIWIITWAFIAGGVSIITGDFSKSVLSGMCFTLAIDCIRIYNWMEQNA